ncbi:conjugative transposon TraN protein [Algoriphagus iocasae]|uniref:Conjugative transposon TraN protein n=1 Tax=Algoriphagus iocasae TaxID=1836499 RepID=A0A841MR27_9BACT|nr:DUF4138 domain-containing protein [Algoriphagus iocasae]MBB6324481.1 conjugative transposon TraN protein [Algoriphagus iocasae]
MKTFMILIALGLSQICHAQFAQQARVKTYPLGIGWNKTTVLIFPAAVVSADFGNGAILAEKDPEAPHILKLKAGERYFPSTSMYVMTVDKELYPFTVSYTNYPDARPIKMAEQKNAEHTTVKLKGTGLTPGEVADFVGEAASREPGAIKWGKRQGKVRLGTGQVFQHEGVLFFQLAVENNSNIDFLTEKWEFFIRDKKQSRRTAVRRVPLEPVARKTAQGVGGKSGAIVVFAFSGFTISDAKIFEIRCFEKNGDRHSMLAIREKKILKADPIVLPQPKQD